MACLLCSKGQSLRCSPGQGNPHPCVVMLYMGEGSEKEQCHLLLSLPVFSHFPCYPQANWALMVLISGWVGLCTFWDPVGLSSELSCEAGSFSHCCLNPHRCFYSEVLGCISPLWSPGLRGLLRFHFVPPGLSVHKCGTAGPPAAAWPAPFHNLPPRRVHQPPPCRESSPPGCPSPPLPLVWMNVSSLSPWLLDFIQFDFLSVLVVFCF